MFEMDLPYDKKTLHLRLEDKNFAGVLTGTTPEEALQGRTCVWIGKEVGEIGKLKND